jgi:acetylglutamate kinase
VIRTGHVPPPPVAATRVATVIKLGGRVQRDPRLAGALASRWRDAVHQPNPATPSGVSGAVCLVHGGGDEVTDLQRALGIEPAFVRGRRVTAAEDIDVLRMALSGSANKRLVATLCAAGVPAIGLSGEDAHLLVADRVRDAGLGAVGTVRRVDVALLLTLIGAGYLPVISPLAADSVASDTLALNVNGDDAAAAVAAAVGAHELLFVADVGAVRVAGQAVSDLSGGAADRAIAAGDITAGMEAKVRAALAALDAGVASVRIGGLGLLTGSESGTRIARGDGVTTREHDPRASESVA